MNAFSSLLLGCSQFNRRPKWMRVLNQSTPTARVHNFFFSKSNKKLKANERAESEERPKNSEWDKWRRKKNAKFEFIWKWGQRKHKNPIKRSEFPLLSFCCFGIWISLIDCTQHALSFSRRRIRFCLHFIASSQFRRCERQKCFRITASQYEKDAKKKTNFFDRKKVSQTLNSHFSLSLFQKCWRLVAH